MKKNLKTIIKISIFFLIANIPFITMTQLIGMETFLDSFENPEHYYCLKSDTNLVLSTTANREYLIIQNQEHPDFNIQEGDMILYHNYQGEILHQRVKQINSIGAIKFYNPIINDDMYSTEVIYDNQILGKVVNIIDNNIINSLSMKMWDISIHNLNFNSLING